MNKRIEFRTRLIPHSGILFIFIVILTHFISPVLAADTCPSGCLCYTEANAKILGYSTYCSGKQTICGYETGATALIPKYCFQIPTKYVQCPSGCLCRSEGDAKIEGLYTYCGKQKSLCGYDKTQYPMYCWEKPATTIPTTVPPVTKCSSSCNCLSQSTAKTLGSERCLPDSGPCGYDEYKNYMYCYQKSADQCPAGCLCLTGNQATAKFGKYVQCTDKACGYDTGTLEARYCVKAAPANPCAASCSCLPPETASIKGYTELCDTTKTPCNWDSNGQPMFCYRYPAETGCHFDYQARACTGTCASGKSCQLHTILIDNKTGNVVYGDCTCQATGDYDSPSVSISHIPSDVTTEDLVTFTARAWDSSGISRIEIFIAGQKVTTCLNTGSCSFAGGPYPAGLRYYSANATDPFGKSGNATALLRVIQKIRVVTPPTCCDGIRNQDETGIDCGGSNCPPCNRCNLAAVPGSFDWRDYLTFPGARDQAQCGACWAFSALGAVEGTNLLTHCKGADLAEQYAVSDCGISGSCYGGWPDNVLDHVNKKGIVDETCFPFRSMNCLYPGNSTCTSSCSCGGYCARPCGCSLCTGWEHRLWQIGLYDSVSHDRTEIKKALICHGPLSVCSEKWEHCITLVGYNDNTKSWVIRNSWGPTWNGTGYGIIPYTGHPYSDIVDYVYYVDTVSRGFRMDFEESDDLAAGDVNGDGKDEIIHGDRGDMIRIYSMDGRRISQFELDFEEGDGLAAGDVNGDGEAEIIHADRSNWIRIYNWQGTRYQQAGLDFEKGDGLAAGDVDNDGRTEVIHGDRVNLVRVIKPYGSY